MTDDIPPEAMNEILELINDNQKIEAVKRYKQLRGTSLLEAKQFIEQLTEELRKKHPEKFSSRSRTGCAGVIALVAITLAATIALLMMVLNLNL